MMKNKPLIVLSIFITVLIVWGVGVYFLKIEKLIEKESQFAGLPCDTEEGCKAYCANLTKQDECRKWCFENKKRQEFCNKTKLVGPCTMLSPDECNKYCTEHTEECQAYNELVFGKRPYQNYTNVSEVAQEPTKTFDMTNPPEIGNLSEFTRRYPKYYKVVIDDRPPMAMSEREKLAKLGANAFNIFVHYQVLQGEVILREEKSLEFIKKVISILKAENWTVILSINYWGDIPREAWPKIVEISEKWAMIAEELKVEVFEPITFARLQLSKEDYRKFYEPIVEVTRKNFKGKISIFHWWQTLDRYPIDLFDILVVDFTRDFEHFDSFTPELIEGYKKEFPKIAMGFNVSWIHHMDLSPDYPFANEIITVMKETSIDQNSGFVGYRSGYVFYPTKGKLAFEKILSSELPEDDLGWNKNFTLATTWPGKFERERFIEIISPEHGQLVTRMINTTMKAKDNGIYSWAGKTVRFEKIPIYVEVVAGLGDEQRKTDFIKMGEIPADGKEHIVETVVKWEFEPLTRAGYVIVYLGGPGKIVEIPELPIESFAAPVYFRK